MGVLLAMGIVIVYYLASLLGESLARVGTLTPATGIWIASVLLLVVSLLMLTVNRFPRLHIWSPWKSRRVRKQQSGQSAPDEHTLGLLRSGFLSLLDVSLFRTLSISFLFGFVALVTVFIIFTLFELWRFIGTNRVGMGLVARYLLFLLPLLSVELFPATMLIAVLITYALLARRREAVAWWASGQSVYRLMMPGIVFSILAGAGVWLIQEHLMPTANVRQDALRAQIRGGEARAIAGTGAQWLASTESTRLYSYEYDEHNASLQEPVIYDFDADGVHLRRITKANSGNWVNSDRLLLKNVESISMRGLEIDQQHTAEFEVAGIEPPQIFRPTVDKPSQLSSDGLRAYLSNARRRGMEVSALALALQRKYATPFGAVVMAFLGIPLALSFGRKGAVIALCIAVGVSVAYLGMSGGFQQLGNYGLLPPAVAAWSPVVIFAAIGTYFLSRLRT
jgi:LPS export ABC transporter permease LptG